MKDGSSRKEGEVNTIDYHGRNLAENRNNVYEHQTHKNNIGYTPNIS
jgi:hypothetical protein